MLCLTGGVDVPVKHTAGKPTSQNGFHDGVHINHTPRNTTTGCLCTPSTPLVMREVYFGSVHTVSDDDEELRSLSRTLASEFHSVRCVTLALELG